MAHTYAGRRSSSSDPDHDVPQRATPLAVPGRRTLTELGSSGSALPHLDLIQRSFGRHDVSKVVAHTGAEATEAAHAMGAAAFANGNHVVFAAAPDLHAAAHEAAHVIQQRGGVTLAGGVGQAGDRYEQHADAVADLVVRGQSSEALLDQMVGAGAASSTAGGDVVQCIELSQEQINALPSLNPRQLRELLTRANDDHQSLSSELAATEQLLALQEVQAEVMRVLGASPGQIEAMDQQAGRVRGEINAVRALGEQLLASVVDPQLAREVQSLPPVQSEQEQAPRQQAIANRRRELTEQALRLPGLQPQLQLLQQRTQQLQQQLGQLERAGNELLQRMQQAMQERLHQLRTQRSLPDDIPNGVIDLIKSFRSKRDVQTLRQNVQQLRQRVLNNQSAGRAIEQVYRNLGMIAVAQDVIAETQGRISVGAGNQIQDLARTNGLSRELTNLVRSIARMPSQNRLVQIAQEGAIASMLHAGNCGEHASVAYCLLWQRLAGRQLTYYAHSMDHAFVVIGDPGDRDSVVCDAWPRSAVALTLRDFFVQYGINDLRNVRYSAISTGDDLMAQARATVDVETIQSRMEEERPPISREQAQQQYGGRGVYDHQHTRL